MRHSFKTLLLIGGVFALSGCESVGYWDTAPPYEQGRTAGHTSKTVAKAPIEKAAPVVQQCDYTPMQTRISILEDELRLCRESTSRVSKAYRDELKK